MDNKLQKFNTLEIPAKWQPRYVLKRIEESDLEIPKSTRDAILQALANNGRYVQIGEYTIMLNSIKSIDPVWGKKNIPPRPLPITKEEFEGTVAHVAITNQAEMDLWDSVFGEAKLDDWTNK